MTSQNVLLLRKSPWSKRLHIPVYVVLKVLKMQLLSSCQQLIYISARSGSGLSTSELAGRDSAHANLFGEPRETEPFRVGSVACFFPGVIFVDLCSSVHQACANVQCGHYLVQDGIVCKFIKNGICWNELIDA